jgi:hypothetical protein
MNGPLLTHKKIFEARDNVTQTSGFAPESNDLESKGWVLLQGSFKTEGDASTQRIKG